MAVIVVTDNFYYMQGLKHVVDNVCHVECINKFKDDMHQGRYPGLHKDDYVIINFTPLDKMIEVYDFYLRYSQANIVLATDVRLEGKITGINNTYFISSDANVTTVELFQKNQSKSIRKRALSIMEEKTMSLMMSAQAMSDVSQRLGINMKIISFHKHSVISKTGLISRNNIALYSLMKFVLREYDGFPMPEDNKMSA